MVIRLYVTHDSGAEVLSLADDVVIDGLSNRDASRSSWKGMQSSSQVCALLSSFTSFEEGQGLQTKSTRSDKLSIHVGVRNERAKLQPFVILSRNQYGKSDEELDFVHVVDKCIDMIVSPLCIGVSRKNSANLVLSSKDSKTLELRSVLTQVLKSIHFGTLLSSPESDRLPWPTAALTSHPSFSTTEDLLATMHHVSEKVSEQLSYCATMWIQQDSSPLVWTDKDVLIPQGGGKRTSRTTNLHTLRACVTIVQCKTQCVPYHVHKVYLGDEFLEDDQDPDAAVCGLHIFKTQRKSATTNSETGMMCIALVCEGSKPFPKESEAYGLILNLLSKLR